VRNTRWFIVGLAFSVFACGSTSTESSEALKSAVEEPLAVALPSGVPAPPTAERAVPLAVRRAEYAITKILLEDAERILEREVGPDAAIARARLSIYQGDCEGALVHLASSAARKAPRGQAHYDFAKGCARATAGSLVIFDEKAGVWLRLQDDRDRVLAPLLIDVANRARAALQKDLGVVFPRPLRIDLVRDLFSLAAVSGLPVDAAETTGTVAVAKWGRITMVSPRAMNRGFPWADTLAHEITHLMLSLATADRAPLWLQEGIAKREEIRWREAQAFDEQIDFAEEAYQAQVSGKSVGVDAIGPSIAMLPSAEAASIAFSEVTAFMDYWIQVNGPHALSFLLRDMEVAPDPESAMRSVSGFDVADWQTMWRAELERRYASAPTSEEHSVSDVLGPRALMRSLRLAELLSIDGHNAEAAEFASPELDRASHSSALRFLLSRAALLSERNDADFLLGDLDDVSSPHAGWLALSAARLGRNRSNAASESLRGQALGLDPLLAEVACGGQPWVGKGSTIDNDVGFPEQEMVDELCREARSLPVRGSR
jgi:hypothetical protein